MDFVVSEVDKLNQQGKYAESYQLCEMVLIDWGNLIEWFDDNKWYLDENQGKPRCPSFRLMDLFAIAAYYTGNYKRAFYISYKLHKSSFMNNPQDFGRLRRNMVFSIEKVKEMLDFYPQDIIERLVNRKSSSDMVTLTMTTCKRLDLFKRTVNSFLNSCRDIDLIDRFIIIDDNSSKEDIDKIKELYPFFELICKSPEEKGHPISMNKIRDMVTSEYCLHLEDDHQFFCNRNYIKPSIRIMEEDQNIKQVLFNENYGEIATDLPKIMGGDICFTKKGDRYRRHVFYPFRSEEYNKYMATIGGPSNTHWPHFSFRPSLFKTEIWKTVGDYKMEIEFEKRFAERYTAAGYVSAFLMGLHHIHIGRTSHDLKAGANVENAYILNDTRKWGY